MDNDYLRYIIDNKDEGIKLDTILKNRMNLSRRMITGLKKVSGIYLNNAPAFTNIKVKSGDEVCININKEEKQDIKPEYVPLDIKFEDKDLLIINKQPGIVVHPTKWYQSGTLSNGIIFYFRQKGEDTIVRLVNRLDRDTSGLIIIAKNQFSHQALAKLMEKDEVKKIYMAIVHGTVNKDEGTIDMPIDRPTKDSIKREVMQNGAKSITTFKVRNRFNGASLLEIVLKTGRTHQIRVHMSHIGHPIYGDTLYGSTDDSLYIQRQALHSFQTEFYHPRTGEKIIVESNLPDDMITLIDRLK